MCVRECVYVCRKHTIRYVFCFQQWHSDCALAKMRWKNIGYVGDDAGVTDSVALL